MFYSSHFGNRNFHQAVYESLIEQCGPINSPEDYSSEKGFPACESQHFLADFDPLCKHEISWLGTAPAP